MDSQPPHWSILRGISGYPERIFLTRYHLFLFIQVTIQTTNLNYETKCATKKLVISQEVKIPLD